MVDVAVVVNGVRGMGRPIVSGMKAHNADDARDDDAQAEYDNNPGLRELLTQAARSPMVRRDRADDVDDAHRDRVHEIARRILDRDVTLFQGLKDADNGDHVDNVHPLRHNKHESESR